MLFLHAIRMRGHSSQARCIQHSDVVFTILAKHVDLEVKVSIPNINWFMWRLNSNILWIFMRFQCGMDSGYRFTAPCNVQFQLRQMNKNSGIITSEHVSLVMRSLNNTSQTKKPSFMSLAWKCVSFPINQIESLQNYSVPSRHPHWNSLFANYVPCCEGAARSQCIPHPHRWNLCIHRVRGR